MTDAFILENGARLPIALDAQLWRGGEGAIRSIRERPDQVAKIIHPGHGRFSREKIEAMIASPPEHLSQNAGDEDLPVFAWPTALVEDEPGQAIGFVMQRIDRERAVTLEKYMTRLSAAQALSENDRSLNRRMQVCRNLAAAIAELHRQAHFIVDLKPANVLMFKDTCVVCLIDNDSFSIGARDGSRFTASAYSQEYLSPELLRGNLTPESVINDWQDRFALAVVMFQILNNGIHPFQGVPGIEVDSWNTDFCVRQRYYPYGRTPCPESGPVKASTHDCWDDQTRALFDRTFTAQRPSQRVSAAEWRDHFDRLVRSTDSFRRCGRHPNEVTHIHVVGRDCPECRFDALAAQIPSAALPPVPVFSTTEAAPILPPVKPGKHGWLYGILAAGVAVVIAVIVAIWPTPPHPLQPPPPEKEDPGTNQNSQGQVQPPTLSPEEQAKYAAAVKAERMASPDDQEGIGARIEMLVKEIMAAAIQENKAEILNIMKLARSGDDAVTVDTARTGIRNTQFAARMASWKRFRDNARRLSDDAREIYRTDLPRALDLQTWAVALDPLGREFVGNFAYFLVLSGRDEEALKAALFAITLPREEGRIVRIADWDTIGAALARSNKPEPATEAYLVALASTSDLSGFCKSLLNQQSQLGEKLKAPIDAVFRRIQERGQSDTPGCAYPPQWKGSE